MRHRECPIRGVSSLIVVRVLTVRYAQWVTHLASPLPPGSPPGPASSRRWQQVAGGLVLLEAVVVLAAAIFSIWQLASGSAVVVRNEAMLSALLLVAGLGLLVVARGLARGRRALRMPCLVFQLLVGLGTVPGLWAAHRPAAAVAVALLATLTGYAAVRATIDEPHPAGDRSD